MIKLNKTKNINKSLGIMLLKNIEKQKEYKNYVKL